MVAIDGSKFEAVNSNHGFGDQAQLLTHDYELAADTADGLAVVLAEIGNSLEVRHQSAGQPHQFDVALRLLFKPPAGLDSIEATIDVDLQKTGGW